LTNFVVERSRQFPIHTQIKDQIRLACLYQRLHTGDALPSIRQLAHQLGVGDGVVRRAYRELCDVGLLEAQGRRHVVGTPARAAGSRTDIVRASTEQCDRLLAWAREERLSAIALSRLLLWHAFARENDSPSGSKYRFHVRTISEIEDLNGLLQDKRHQLLLFSPLSWEGLPSRFRRLARVSPAFYEPNPRALEKVRLAAGVLL